MGRIGALLKPEVKESPLARGFIPQSLFSRDNTKEKDQIEDLSKRLFGVLKGPTMLVPDNLDNYRRLQSRDDDSQRSTSPLNTKREEEFEERDQSKGQSLQVSSTHEKSVDYFGIPTMIVTSPTPSEDALSEVSVETAKGLQNEPHTTALVRQKNHLKLTSYFIDREDDWPSDEEGKDKTDNRQDLFHQERSPVAAEVLKCSGSFHNRLAKAREARARRLRRRQFALMGNFYRVSRDHTEENMSELAPSSTSSSVKEEQDPALFTPAHRSRYNVL